MQLTWKKTESEMTRTSSLESFHRFGNCHKVNFTISLSEGSQTQLWVIYTYDETQQNSFLGPPNEFHREHYLDNITEALNYAQHLAEVSDGFFKNWPY